MPACTGLPPGLLIFSTTPTVPESSNALSSAVLMSSAFALVLAAISPSIVTTAVWRPLASLPPSPDTLRNANASAPSTARNAKRKKILQRRAARCSLIAASATRSSTARSQLGSRGAAFAAGDEDESGGLI